MMDGQALDARALEVEMRFDRDSAHRIEVGICLAVGQQSLEIFGGVEALHMLAEWESL